MIDKKTKCGYVAIIGAPNAGKSTLTNALVGQKITIVTHKVQTTRCRITAIALKDEAQIIFLDTPGIFTLPKSRLDRSMINAAWTGVSDADTVVLTVDATRGLTKDVENILASFQESQRPLVLVLNKIDLIKKEKLLALAATLSARLTFSEIFMLSAEKGSGIQDFGRYIASTMPEGEWLYPEDQLADIPERLLAAEVTREKILLRCHQEIPYNITVETESFKSCSDGSVRISQIIFVVRDAHKKILIGKSGAQIKTISMLARTEMTEVFDRPVHLFLIVKVRDNWQEDPERYKQMGLRFNV